MHSDNALTQLGEVGCQSKRSIDRSRKTSVYCYMSDDLHKDADSRLFAFARGNRSTMTEAEKILWSCLRNRKFHRFKFRRQHPVADFIADFYCHEAKLVVEVEGDYHNDSEQRTYDENRTYNLKEFRIKVIRFTNAEVINNLDYVLHEISTHLLDTCPNWDTP